MISLRDVVTGFCNRDPLAEVWRQNLRNGGGGGGGAAVITGSLPLRYIGNGTPLSDYLISGNTIQDGTPTPEAPVNVVGCGARTDNLFDYETMSGGKTNYYLDASGNEIENIGFWSITKYIPVDGTVFTLARTFIGSAPAICLYDSNKNFITGVSYQGEQVVTISSNTNAAYIRFSYFIGEPLEDIAHDMLNTGSTALPYEPYGYKIPLTVNGTEYPIFLGQVPTTRRIKKLVLTGKENWRKSSAYSDGFFLKNVVTDYVSQYKPAYCSHFVQSTTQQDYTSGKFMLTGDLNIRCGEDQWTLTDWTTWLFDQYANGTPVTVWYVLAEPETGIVNEPLMKIGDYADTISFAQAGVTIPTVSGANVLDMTSPVKPSEVYIKGNGIKPTNDPNFENGG